MDKGSYALLFDEQAGVFPGVSEPLVEFHGEPNPTRPLAVDEALDLLWLSTNRFYRVVDVAAVAGEDNPPVIFVRPAGFEPSGYEDTWEPEGLGPFKVLGPATRPAR